jgi:hypothetical protein
MVSPRYIEVMSKLMDEPQREKLHEICSCGNGAEAQPAEQAAVQSHKGEKGPIVPPRRRE